MGLLSAFYLLVIIIGSAAQNALKKYFNNKSGGNVVYTFGAVSVATACLFFLVRCGFRLNLSGEIIPYSILFALSYTAASVFSFLAIRSGPLSLTSLAISYSLLIPTFYGIIVDKDETGVFLFVGLLLLAVSIFLIAAKKSESKITLRWLIFALLALLGNGTCSTVQAVQTVKFSGIYDSSFMVLALVIVTSVLAALSLTLERDRALAALKIGLPIMLVYGVANATVNLFCMLAAEIVNKSIMYPLISAGGIVVTWIISVTIYKEKLTIKQNVGMVFGVLSIVFLNL